MHMCLSGGTPNTNDWEKQHMVAESILDGTTKKSAAGEEVGVMMCTGILLERFKGVRGNY